MTDRLSEADISEMYLEVLSVQSYSGSDRIVGVEVVDLRPFAEDGGTFLELGRFNEVGDLLGVDDFKVRQMNYSMMAAGAVKAWHLHFNQEDVWFVPPDSHLVVGLVDCRKGSPTEHDTMRFLLGAGRPRLLLIPRGVAHGVANMTKEWMRLIYLTNQHFDFNDPDERRLPWDHFGKDFWEMSRG